MKNFNSVGASGIVWDSGLFSSEIIKKSIFFLTKEEDEKDDSRLTLNRQFNFVYRSVKERTIKFMFETS